MHKTVQRIVSLVPSQTELLHHLGLVEEVVGITKFCIHPNEWFRSKTRVGGTKTVNIEKVRSLQPDLILANKEENVMEQVQELEKIAPVYVSDIKNLDDALEMIRQVGQLVGKEQRAVALVAEIVQKFGEIKPLATPLRTAYFIWKNPYMAAGGDTFINDMMKRCGFKNIFQEVRRYPVVELKDTNNVSSTNQKPPAVSVENCELLLLSSEPFPFTQKHVDELQSILSGTKIVLVDGEMFSWYGSRLLNAAGYFTDLIHRISRLM